MALPRYSSGGSREFFGRSNLQTGWIYSSIASAIPCAFRGRLGYTALESGPVRPWKVVRGLPLLASQSRAVLSPEAVSTRRPSGLKRHVFFGQIIHKNP